MLKCLKDFHQFIFKISVLFYLPLILFTQGNSSVITTITVIISSPKLGKSTYWIIPCFMKSFIGKISKFLTCSSFQNDGTCLYLSSCFFNSNLIQYNQEVCKALFSTMFKGSHRNGFTCCRLLENWTL